MPAKWEYTEPDPHPFEANMVDDRIEYLAMEQERLDMERALNETRRLVLSAYLAVLRDDAGWTAAQIVATVTEILDGQEVERRR